MPCADIFLVYDLLGIAIARGQLDVPHYGGEYTRPEILSCLCMLWRERMIKPPVVAFVAGDDSVISLDHGASECGREMHRFLRETLLASPGFKGVMGRSSGKALMPALAHRAVESGGKGAHVLR